MGRNKKKKNGVSSQNESYKEVTESSEASNFQVEQEASVTELVNEESKADWQQPPQHLLMEIIDKKVAEK